MKKIVIFHFNPLEFYPPVTNFLNCLQERLSKNDLVWVYTTRPTSGMELYIPGTEQVVIKRLALFTLGLPTIKRVLQYLRYYLLSFLQCIRINPSKVFYYETLSAFTSYLLMKWKRDQISLFVHYHEYMTPVEYKRMKLNQFFHRLELKIYDKAKWISHTNEYRMRLFLNDIKKIEMTNTHIFPNYPPAAWNSFAKDAVSRPVKMVYVGSMGSLESLYIAEIFKWVRSQSGQVRLDIYSFEVASEIRNYFEQESFPYISFKGAIAYNELPTRLRQYQVGIILYKGLSANVIYSVPNKLFEYLACGLDVWYPAELTGCRDYNSIGFWPKVLPLDFLNLEQYDIEELVERKRNCRRQIAYTCEEAGKDLITMILE